MLRRQFFSIFGMAFALLPVMFLVPAMAAEFKYATADMAAGCNIRLKVPNEAEVASSRENRGSGSVTMPNPRHLKTRSYIAPLYFGFVCYDAATKDLHKGEPVRYDANKGKWVRDSANMLNNGTEGWTSAEKRMLECAVHFYELRAVNAQGYAYTQDDINGDEDSRMRRLHYCLIHPPKALCGDGDMGYLNDGRKGDLTRYSLRILRSIEFIDDAAPTTSKGVPTVHTQAK